MRHVGVRPEYDIELIEDGRTRKTYIERLPDGGYRVWNKRLLRSGCGEEIDVIEVIDNLIYCHVCKEWANESQFV